jgi:hypothetical protein
MKKHLIILLKRFAMYLYNLALTSERKKISLFKLILQILSSATILIKISLIKK